MMLLSHSIRVLEALTVEKILRFDIMFIVKMNILIVLLYSTVVELHYPYTTVSVAVFAGKIKF